jgi:hypothetical protein
MALFSACQPFSLRFGRLVPVAFAFTVTLSAFGVFCNATIEKSFYLDETFSAPKNKLVIVNFFAFKNNYACLIYAKKHMY